MVTGECVGDARVNCAKTAERIVSRFGERLTWSQETASRGREIEILRGWKSCAREKGNTCRPLTIIHGLLCGRTYLRTTSCTRSLRALHTDHLANDLYVLATSAYAAAFGSRVPCNVLTSAHKLFIHESVRPSIRSYRFITARETMLSAPRTTIRRFSNPQRQTLA